MKDNEARARIDNYTYLLSLLQEEVVELRKDVDALRNTVDRPTAMPSEPTVRVFGFESLIDIRVGHFIEMILKHLNLELTDGIKLKEIVDDDKTNTTT